MLTPRQHQVLVFLDDFTSEHGFAPSYEQISEAMDMNAKSNIHRMILRLDELGFIHRIPRRSRAIEVLHVPGRNKREQS